MSAPNTALRAVRIGMRMSQDDLARAIRAVGDRIGIPNDVQKRTVQRWESGAVTTPRPAYARALEALTGLPIANLGFTVPVPGHDEPGDPTHTLPATANGTLPTAAGPHRHYTGYSGVWLSRYEYHSSGRGGVFTGLHYVVILQHGDRLTVRSLPGSADSRLTMDLTVDGSVITGTWVEQTAADGYYRGARYHGAIQMLAEPTGRRTVGKWVGFGTEMDINTGPWELLCQDSSTGRAALDRYNRRPEV